MVEKNQEILVPRHRVLYRNESGQWDIKLCETKSEVDAWMIGHPGSVFLRYVVVSDGGNLHCETKEDAMKKSDEEKLPWSLVNPGSHLCSNALEKAYAA